MAKAARICKLLVGSLLTMVTLVTLSILQLPFVSNLMETFGFLSYSEALLIAHLVCSGSITVLASLFPWLIPFIPFLQSLCQFGISYIVAW